MAKIISVPPKTKTQYISNYMKTPAGRAEFKQHEAAVRKMDSSRKSPPVSWDAAAAAVEHSMPAPKGYKNLAHKQESQR